MYITKSLVVILLARALTVIAPSLSASIILQGAMAATNGQNGQNGKADSISSAKGGPGGTGNAPNSGFSNNGNGGIGGIAVERSSANGGAGGTGNNHNFDHQVLVMEMDRAAVLQLMAVILTKAVLMQ
jgi:hypothetical protein